MTAASRVVQARWPAGMALLADLPVHAPDGYTSESTPGSLGVSFTGHTRCAWSLDGALRDGDLAPGASQVVGAAPVRWHRVREPALCLELVPSPSLAGDLGAWQAAAVRAPAHRPVVHAIARRFEQALRGRRALDALAAEELLRAALAAALPASLGEGGRAPRGRFDRVLAFVEDHLGEALDLTALADVAGVSVFHFARSFRAAHGMPPSAYLRMRRMERAAELMAVTSLPVAAVALRCGYESTSHFHAAFRAHHGVSPGAVRG